MGLPYPLTSSGIRRMRVWPPPARVPMTLTKIRQRRRRIRAQLKRSNQNELLSPQLTISVLIEKAEGLLEFSNLFFGQLVSHGGNRIVVLSWT